MGNTMNSATKPEEDHKNVQESNDEVQNVKDMEKMLNLHEIAILAMFAV